MITTKDVCSVCGKELARRKTIWAVEGSLYCSRKCVKHNYTDLQIAEIAEEVNPIDIGIE